MNTSNGCDLVSFSRSTSSPLPEWVKRILAPTLQDCGPAQLDATLLERYKVADQSELSLSGQEIYQRLEHIYLGNFIGWRELNALQSKGLSFYRSHFAEGTIVGWKSVVANASEQLFVPFLGLHKVTLDSGSTQGLILDWAWLGNRHFFQESMSLRFPPM